MAPSKLVRFADEPGGLELYFSPGGKLCTATFIKTTPRVCPEILQAMMSLKDQDYGKTKYQRLRKLAHYNFCDTMNLFWYALKGHQLAEDAPQPFPNFGTEKRGWIIIHGVNSDQDILMLNNPEYYERMVIRSGVLYMCYNALLQYVDNFDFEV